MTRRRWLLVGATVLVVWLAAAGVLLARAASDLRAGSDAAERARQLFDVEALAEGRPLRDLRIAAERFDAAAGATGHPLLAPVRFLPVVGRQLRSVDALSTAAAEVSDTGAEAVAAVSVVLGETADGAEARLRQVRLTAEAVADASERLGRITDLGPIDGLVGPLADARNELASELDEARAALADASAGTAAALTFLTGPRRYLLVAANNAEMRAGSGMWLSAGVLSTADGELSLGDMRRSYEAVVPAGAVEPTGALAERWGWLQPSTEWRNLMLSPDFPASAELAARMWVAAGREEVDGVLVLDPVALRALVAAIGGVDLGGLAVGVDDVVPLLLHDQYELYDGEAGLNEERYDALGALTAVAFDAFEKGSWDPVVFARELADAARNRHVLVWSKVPAEQAGWEAAGVAGSLGPRSVAVSLMNTGGNKLDWFIGQKVDLAHSPVADGTEVRLTATFANVTPEGEPRYVAGPHDALDDELAEGDYRGILAFTIPGSAANVRLDGVPIEIRGLDGPTQVIGGRLIVRRGATLTATVTFVVPPTVEWLELLPSARVPSVEWHHRDGSWEEDGLRTAKLSLDAID